MHRAGVEDRIGTFGTEADISQQYNKAAHGSGHDAGGAWREAELFGQDHLRSGSAARPSGCVCPHTACRDVRRDGGLSALVARREDAPQEEAEEEDTAAADQAYSTSVITALAVVSVWTACLIAFVVLWLAKGLIWWTMFAIALPVSLLVLVVLMSVFKKERYLQFAIAGFVFSLFVMLYFVIPNYKPWQLF